MRKFISSLRSACSSSRASLPGYLSIKLGGMELIGSQGYDVYALFSTAEVSAGSSVMIAGVEVGRIRSISLDDYQARIVMNLNRT